jgi:hypothetical protein
LTSAPLSATSERVSCVLLESPVGDGAGNTGNWQLFQCQQICTSGVVAVTHSGER